MTSKCGGGNRAQLVRWTTSQIIEFQRRILRDGGQDPGLIPDEPFRFIALPELRSRLSLSTTTIYRAMAAGKLPRPVTLDGLTTVSNSRTA
jgi:predicted DNA-binding transcriptional regulator AlpA